MLGCGCVLLSGLLTLTLFHCSVESLHIPQERPEYVESSVVEGRSAQQGQTEQKASGAVNAKHLLHDQLVRLENDVIETKRKRSFPGSNTPLDRLSISNMDPKSNKQRKVELPRRRVSVPIDRIGVGRLPNPNSRG
ncbi:osteocrin isoform X2 [Siphateles boraxobius]